MKALHVHLPRYMYDYGGLSMHNQKRNKLLLAKTRSSQWMPYHIDFTVKNYFKNHSARDISGRATAGHFFNLRYLGTRAKRVK